jgi:hypothetical protein
MDMYIRDDVPEHSIVRGEKEKIANYARNV